MISDFRLPPATSCRAGKSEIVNHRSEIAFVVLLVLGLLAVGTAFADESPAARRERIERMGPEKKQQLLQREVEFESLAPSKQERIRKLHEELQNAPDAEQLRQVMRRYHEWLAALPSYQRAQLLELTPAERIKRIQVIRKEQAVANAWHPGAEDFKVIYRWQDDFAPKYESRLLEGVKDDQRQRSEERRVGKECRSRWSPYH